MRFKYFIRGLGVGILFCTLILFAAYQTSPNKLLTDEEVKTRAKELGMVEEQSSLEKVIQGDTSEDETNSSEENEKDSETTMEENNSSTEQTTEDNNTTTEENTGLERTTTEGTTADEDSTVQTTTEDKNTTAEGTTTEKVITATITVTPGMLSSSVAKELENKSIIESASDFDRYLNKNGYATKIRTGTYTVKSSDSYESLAKILTKQ